MRVLEQPDLTRLLASVQVRGWRLMLDRALDAAEIRTLRGVWGMVLRAASPAAYVEIFEGGVGGDRHPRYVLRPSWFDPLGCPAVDCILFGPYACGEAALHDALDEAGRRGLGRARRPLRVIARVPLGPLGAAAPAPGFGLDRAAWPLAHDAPCDLTFVAPVRLLRSGVPVRRPGLAELADGCLRRVASLARADTQRISADARLALGQVSARRAPATVDTHAATVSRWSARQRAQLSLRGVIGSVHLPDGPGSLAPLLAAGLWTHVGKGTIFGMGRFVVAPPGA